MISRALFFLLLFALQIWGKESVVVFLVGDSEYKTAETVPAWARKELEPLGVRCIYFLDDPDKPFDFPRLATLEKADALFISIKRRGLPPAQLAAIRAFAESGKPIIGIRTASHALAPKKPADGEATWPTFDRDVFGGHYENHYGKGPATIARIEAGSAAHPILTAIPFGELRFSSHLYKCRELAPSTKVLLTANVEGKPAATEPLAWLNLGDKRRTFYTSLGSPEDFEQAAFRRLLLNATLWLIDHPVPPAQTK